MIKIAILLSFFILSGCSILEPKIITKTEYIEVNTCKELPMPNKFEILNWHFESNTVQIDGVEYLVLNIAEYEKLIVNSQNTKEYISKLKKLIKLCKIDDLYREE